MSLRIVKHRKLKRDALKIYLYIGEDNLQAAKRFLRAMNQEMRKLADMPGMGAIRDFEDAKLSGIRSWPITGFTNYLILYRFTASDLLVLRVIHGARDLEAALLE